MSEDKPGPTPDDHTQPVRPEGGSTLPPAPAAGEAAAGQAPAPAVATTEQPVARRGFRERLRRARTSDGDRAFSLGALVASALAGLIVGGLGMAAVHAATDDHRDGPGWDRRGPMMGNQLGDRDDDGDRRGPMFGGPGMPGGIQPTTPPDDDSDSGGSSS